MFEVTWQHLLAKPWLVNYYEGIPFLIPADDVLMILFAQNLVDLQQEPGRPPGVESWLALFSVGFFLSLIYIFFFNHELFSRQSVN